jgi:hypothetical protein
MPDHRVAIVAGARTPFVKGGQAFASLGPLALARHAVQGLIDRHEIDPNRIDAMAFGAVVPEPGKPNLAREIVLETGLPAGIEAQTVSSYCITGLRTATVIADAIGRGRIEAGIAGGVEWLSGADPSTFKEPTTGLTMGQHMELTRAEWNIPRARQDEIALASHRNALAARERLAREIVPVEGLSADTGPRPDTSLEKLATLKPVFAPDGTITAGNASPVTDGASALLLMSERRAEAEGREPLAFIGAMDYAAIHPNEGLLMPHPGRHRPDRDPRGVRRPGAGQRGGLGAGLEGPAHRSGGLEPGQRERQLGRGGPSLGRHRRPDPHHPGLRDEATQRASGPDQHLRGGRDGGSDAAYARRLTHRALPAHGMYAWLVLPLPPTPAMAYTRPLMAPPLRKERAVELVEGV